MTQVNQLQAAINGLQAQGLIKQSTYINKDQALAELKSRPEGPEHHRPGRLQPVPANFRLKPTDVEKAPQIVAALKDQPAVDSEQGISYGKETADKLLSVARFIQWAGLGLITILLVASILLIGNTIRLSIFARRREVEVMKLVGATNWFIRWPFVIEGIVCGLMGAVLSVGAAVGREGGRRGPVDRGRRQRPHARRGHHHRLPHAGPDPDRRRRHRGRARQRHHAAPLPQGLVRPRAQVSGPLAGTGVSSERVSRRRQP